MPHTRLTRGDHPAPTCVWDWIAFLSAVAVLVVTVAVGRGGSAPLRWVGVAVLALAVPLIVAPFLLLPRHGGVAPGAPYYDTTTVVAVGPYAVVRHPQYLGYILLVLGFALLSQHLLTALLSAIAIGTLWVHTIREERQCERRLGDEYQAYARRVPRFNLLLGLVRWMRGRRTGPQPP
jgi:protein-S-isoprenylcysteine O-methyltransferase Ste14